MDRRTTVPILLACTCACACAFALLAPPAFADYVGLEVVENLTQICKDPSEPEIPFKLDVCEIHVVLDDPADRLISVAFSNVSTTDTNGFYQHSLGGNTAPLCSLISPFPTLVCDSFVTLGPDCDALDDASTLDPDFDSTGFNSSGTVSGGWYNSAPPNSQGAPDANDRVMISRFSYKQNKTSSGDVCAFIKLAGSDDITEFVLEPFDCSVPGMQAGTGGGGGGGGGCPTGNIWYVDVDPIDPTDEACCLGSSGCTGWNRACCDLQPVLDRVEPGDQIWVAEGTYKPTKRTVPLDPRTATFTMDNCLQIYGGFNGDEINLSERDVGAHETILSGDLAGDDVPVPCTQDAHCNVSGKKCANGFCIVPDNNGENTYHVVTGSGTDNTAILDGFTIKGGNADTAPNTSGGGMLNDMGSPTVANCTFRGNSCSVFGGGMHIDGSVAVIADCTFSGNYNSNGAGGGMYSGNSNQTITNCTFEFNTAPLAGGGGMCNNFMGAPTITGCTFTDNLAQYGGGMANNGQSNPSVTDCDFIDNDAGKGGGMANEDGSDSQVTDCDFIGNDADDKGAGMYNELSSPTLTICKFLDNGVLGGFGLEGAGIYNHGSSPLVSDCLFQGNNAGIGGGMCNNDHEASATPSSPTLTNCMFLNNSTFYGAGAAISNNGSNPEVIDCKFIGNTVFGDNQTGVAISSSLGSNTRVINSIFAGNLSTIESGAALGVSTLGVGSLTVTNCIVVGNSSPGDGAGILAWSVNNNLTVTNSTIAANSADGVGGGIRLSSISATLDNVILWDNEDSGMDDEAAQISFGASTPTPTVGYGDVMGLAQLGDFCPTLCGGVCCNGNIGADPKFVGGPSATWTTVATYDPLTFQTTFTDINANFGDLMDSFLNPDTAQFLQSLIVSNTATTVTVWGDFKDLGQKKETYQINDYRLDSASGSPCIDAADNNAVALCGLDLDGNERFVDDPATPGTGLGSPEHPLDFVDMGAFEFGSLLLTDCNANALEDDCELTEELVADCNTNDVPDECDIADGTSTDCQDTGVPDDCCEGDLDGDEVVGASDLATLLGAWGDCPGTCAPGTPTCACQADVNNDCDVEALDLAVLLGSWGACQ